MLPSKYLLKTCDINLMGFNYEQGGKIKSQKRAVQVKKRNKDNRRREERLARLREYMRHRHETILQQRKQNLVCSHLNQQFLLMLQPRPTSVISQYLASVIIIEVLEIISHMDHWLLHLFIYIIRHLSGHSQASQHLSSKC